MKSAVSTGQIKEPSVRDTVESRSVFELGVVGGWIWKFSEKMNCEVNSSDFHLDCGLYILCIVYFSGIKFGLKLISFLKKTFLILIMHISTKYNKINVQIITTPNVIIVIQAHLPKFVGYKPP